MAAFTIRVELHNARPTDYGKLHAAMEAAGFSRQIRSDDGTVYFLPTAEYDLLGHFTRAEVLSKAKLAAGTVGKRFAILVTESKGRTWNGLKTV
jgi:hypothetical protein